MLTGRRLAGVRPTSIPSMKTEPRSGCSSPAMMRSSVDLPQPDGPSRAKNSPVSIRSETPASAVTAPNRLQIPSTLTASVMAPLRAATGSAATWPPP